MKPPAPETILNTTFGYDTFKPLQREVIDNVLQRRDTLAIMPTGGGKSLCYQIPALIFPGLTVVVSPLIALMKDQVEQMRAFGVPALFLNSSLSMEEYRENVQQVRAGKVKLLYLAPEGLLTERTLDLLSSVKVDCLTIDEAHCISEWGHDFRPEYRQLAAVRQRFEGVVCLALTATATPRVREDIKNSLGFSAANEFVASFNRENLLIEVVNKTNPLEQLLVFLRRFEKQSGIIYCFSRKQVDELSSALKSRGFSALPYHAGLEDDERKGNQEAFIRDDAQIMVATIAFGMGINKPNVRFVVHYDLPKSIEGYYQEIGRAGRDGLPAHCLLLYSYGDIQKLKYFIDQKDGTERQVAYQHLGALTRYAESTTCRRAPLLTYFGETYEQQNCEMCDNCLNGAQRQVEVTIPAQKLLSCVKRTGERFGTAHVIDVLLGAQNQKILKNNHQNVSTYGIGRELTREQWLSLTRQMIEQGLLNQDEQYSSLSLTAKAYQMLKNREPIYGILDTTDEREYGGKKRAALSETGHDRDLFEILRGKRKELADDANVPPYVIFSDRSLVEMATFFPLSLHSLGRMHGVGKVKLERYGDVFLELIQAYCAHRGFTERPKPDASAAAKSSAKEKGPQRHIEVGEAFNAGQTIDELAYRYDVKPATILDNLTKYAQEGNKLSNTRELRARSGLQENMQEVVLRAFAELGHEYLRPVYDHLNGAITYDELKLLRLVYLSRAG